MITRIKAKNFKCFKNLDAEIRPLTILCGLNGSGKSSLSQIVTCIQQCVLNNSDGRSFVKLGSPSVNLGTSKDVFYQFNNDLDKEILMEVEMDPPSGSTESLTAGISYLYSDIDPDQDRFDLVQTDVSNASRLEAKLRFFRSLRRLMAGRIAPTTSHLYSESAVRERNIGLRGENAVAYLLSNQDRDIGTEGSLLSRLNDWMGVVSPHVSVKVSKGVNDNDVKLGFVYESGAKKAVFRPENVGVGLSVSLPVVLMILTAEPGDCLIIENPESDLHPKGQAELAKLIAGVIRNNVQVIVETHSDHIINGIRLAVNKGIVESEKVIVLFFRRVVIEDENEESFEQYATITPIEIDCNGSLSDYPDGFLDTWGDLIDQIMNIDEDR